MLINYRTAVPAGSDFLPYTNFPEVYHGEEISKAARSAAGQQVSVRVRNTTYCVIIS